VPRLGGGALGEGPGGGGGGCCGGPRRPLRLPAPSHPSRAPPPPRAADAARPLPPPSPQSYLALFHRTASTLTGCGAAVDPALGKLLPWVNSNNEVDPAKVPLAMADVNGDGVAEPLRPNAAPGDPLTGGPGNYKPAFNAWGESTSRGGSNNKPRECLLSWGSPPPAGRGRGCGFGRRGTARPLSRGAPLTPHSPILPRAPAAAKSDNSGRRLLDAGAVRQLLGDDKHVIIGPSWHNLDITDKSLQAIAKTGQCYLNEVRASREAVKKKRPGRQPGPAASGLLPGLPLPGPRPRPRPHRRSSPEPLPPRSTPRPSPLAHHTTPHTQTRHQMSVHYYAYFGDSDNAHVDAILNEDNLRGAMDKFLALRVGGRAQRGAGGWAEGRRRFPFPGSEAGEPGAAARTADRAAARRAPAPRRNRSTTSACSCASPRPTAPSTAGARGCRRRCAAGARAAAAAAGATGRCAGIACAADFLLSRPPPHPARPPPPPNPPPPQFGAALWTSDVTFEFSRAGATGIHMHWGTGGDPTSGGPAYVGVQTNYINGDTSQPYPSVHAPW
jgi:hypothetical protein